MKKFIAVIILACMIGCIWVGFNIRRKVDSHYTTETRYMIASNTESYIAKLNPKIDPAIRKMIADQIDIECIDKNIPPEIVVSLIYRESEFKPWAISKDKAGRPLAHGLMQINPRAHNLKQYSENDLCRIDVNIREGCRILRGYIDTSENMKQALGRYVGSQEFKSYQRDILSTSAELFAMK